MQNFYILVMFLSGTYLAVQLAAWVFFGKMFFPDAGELFESKEDKSLWQTVFPKNMLRLIIVIFIAATAGLLMDAAGLAGWISMPLGVMAGITVNFIVSTAFVPLYDRLRKSGEPRGEELEGLDARVVEDIDADDFGVITVRHGSKSYLMRAVSANERRLPKGTAVVVIYAQDGCCFVESRERLFDVLFEEEE
ncbi:MAG: hypothetical protein NC299_08110 [Lachnospiraceae bacterium]|nr:hypothetical protein [Ruminococcus sp.]MCM1275316.1 hypothetical protein [Lachnospiraceae bacterium]